MQVGWTRVEFLNNLSRSWAAVCLRCRACSAVAAAEWLRRSGCGGVAAVPWLPIAGQEERRCNRL